MTTAEFPCSRCGGNSFDEGFVDDATNGRVRWLEGPVEYGMLGNTKKFGRTQRMVVALRCTNCSRLELIAGEIT